MKYAYLFIILLVLAVSLYSYYAFLNQNPLQSSYLFSFAQFSDLQYVPNGWGKADCCIKFINEMDKVKFVLITGDVPPRGEIDITRVFKQKFDTLNVNYWIILGNHDNEYGTTIEQLKSVYGAHFPGVYYSFEYQGFIFVCIGQDSTQHREAFTNQELAFLESKLKEAKQTGKFVFLVTHIPLITNIRPQDIITNREEVFRLLREYEPASVACISGHIHARQCIQLDWGAQIIDDSVGWQGNGGVLIYNVYMDKLIVEAWHTATDDGNYNPVFLEKWKIYYRTLHYTDDLSFSSTCYLRCFNLYLCIGDAKASSLVDLNMIFPLGENRKCRKP